MMRRENEHMERNPSLGERPPGWRPPSPTVNLVDMNSLWENIKTENRLRGLHKLEYIKDPKGKWLAVMPLISRSPSPQRGSAPAPDDAEVAAAVAAASARTAAPASRRPSGADKAAAGQEPSALARARPWLGAPAALVSSSMMASSSRARMSFEYSSGWARNLDSATKKP